MRTRHLVWIVAMIALVVSGCQRASTRGRSDDSAGRLVLPATYNGTLPCADCPGIATTLTLRADSLFVQRSIYMERDSSAFVELGRWSVDSSHRLVLRGATEAPRLFGIVDAGTVRMLDTQGQPIESPLNSDLVLVAQVDPIRDSFRMRGMFTYGADAASIVECVTGKTWRVVGGADIFALELAYAGGSKDGRPALVLLEVHLAMKPRTDGNGDEEVIVVDRFHKMSADESCDADRSDVPIIGPKWILVELNGKPLPEGLERPTLTLSMDNMRAIGTAGCNHFIGSFNTGSDGMRFARTATTRKVCPDAVMDVERTFLAALEATNNIRVSGEPLEHVLELMGPGGVLAKFSTP